jgi:tetratricopeptide (TPR) repeat protein
MLLITFVQDIKPQTSNRIPPTTYLFYLIIFIFCITSFAKAPTLQNPLTVADATVKFRGNPVMPFLNRGWYFMEKEMYEKATNDFNIVLQLDSLNIASMYNLAHIDIHYGNYKNAVALYTHSLSIKNNDYGVYYSRSFANTHLGNYESALLDLDSAIMINKNSDFLYNNRAVLRMHLGWIEEALEDLEEAVRLSNSMNIDMLFNTAVLKNKLGNSAGALQDCDKALQLEPNNTDVLSLKESILNN